MSTKPDSFIMGGMPDADYNPDSQLNRAPAPDDDALLTRRIKCPLCDATFVDPELSRANKTIATLRAQLAEAVTNENETCWIDALRERAERAERALAAKQDQRETAWLIERGQQEGESQSFWYCAHPYPEQGEWVTDANKATRFTTWAAADRCKEHKHLVFCRVTEHIFIGASPVAAKQDQLPRERFEHYKGGIYDVICVAFTEDKHEEVVVYQGADGRRWVRPYVEFAKNFKRVPA